LIGLFSCTLKQEEGKIAKKTEEESYQILRSSAEEAKSKLLKVALESYTFQVDAPSLWFVFEKNDCDDCINKGIDAFLLLQKQMPNGIVPVAIGLSLEESDYKHYAEVHGLSLTNDINPQDKEKLGTLSTPMLLLIDKNGKVVAFEKITFGKPVHTQTLVSIAGNLLGE
jgi:hypothetical protein